MQNIVIFLTVLTVVVAYFQWVTAHQKIVADLFDRRIKVYELIDEAIVPVLIHAKADDDSYRKITNALIYSRFLFGKDIVDYIEELRGDIIQLMRSIEDRDHNEEAADARSKRIEKKYAALERVTDFMKVGPSKFAPYLRMSQKLRMGWLPG